MVTSGPVVILVNESDFGGMMAQLAAEYIFSAMFGKTALLEKFEKNLEDIRLAAQYHLLKYDKHIQNGDWIIARFSKV